MLTMGIAVQPVADWIGDPARIVDYQVRFTRPVPVDAADGAAVTVTATVGRRRCRHRADRPDRTFAAGRCSARRKARVSCQRELSRVRPRLLGLTSMRVGGPAPHVIRATEPSSLIDATRQAWADADEWLLLGGGSNIVVSDDGFDGTVIRVATRGIERAAQPGHRRGHAERAAAGAGG